MKTKKNSQYEAKNMIFYNPSLKTQTNIEIETRYSFSISSEIRFQLSIKKTCPKTITFPFKKSFK